MLIFSYVFYRNLADKYRLRIKDKTLQKHIFDISDLILYGSIFYLLVFTNPSALPFDIYYAITFIISLAIFGFVLQIPGVDKTVPNIKSWNKNKFIAIILTIIFTIILGKDIFVLNKRNILIYLNSLIILILACFLSYNKNKFKTFHPHHWQIFLLVSIIIIPNNNKTKFLSAMYLSFFAHGIIAHSAASLIKNE
jgi:hypothetical protein